MRIRVTLISTILAYGWLCPPGALVADQQATSIALGSDARSLYLRSGTVDLRAVPSLLEGAAEFEEGVRYVIQIDGPMTPRRREMLVEAGVRLGEYLPMYAYVADLSDGAAAGLAKLDFVAWVGEFDPAWKICPMIGAHGFETPERRALEERGARRLAVRLFETEDAGALVGNLERCGAALSSRQRRLDARQLEVEIPAARLEELRGLSNVMFVEEAAEGRPRNATTAWITQSNVLNATPLWDRGLEGQNQIAGLIDWNMSTTHCALTDPINPIGPMHRKILSYTGSGGLPDLAAHGTHVAGVLAGNDLAEPKTNPNFRGMAPEAKLVFTNQPTEITATNLYERMEAHHALGASVHNNSWGNSSHDYIAWARDIDEFTRDFEDDLVLVAVTNGNVVVEAPENSKNVLAVAASRETPDQGARCFGGFGPTMDGRQKPEVWATGCGSISASSTQDCGTQTMQGTSFAAPAVAAMGLLTRQYFMEGFYPTGAANANDGFTPSGAMLKATIINSAVDMTGFADYFSVNEGWGRVLMDDALYFTGDSRSLFVEDVRNADGLFTSQTDTFMVDVFGDAEPLKITLVWTDVPAALMATFTPVNNLDLVVTDPDGITYFGNVFSGLESATGGEADAVNNAEQVHRLAPVVGTWTIEVVGTAVNQEAQGYAFVVTGDIAAPQGEPDCNDNGTPDDIDIEEKTSPDCNENGIPDECDVDPADPDGDGFVSPDCNGNDTPDECEEPGEGDDCNDNGVADDCDIEQGDADDCNANGIPDECDVDPADPDDDGLVSEDCDADGVPDECAGTAAPDCNDNGVPDACDIDSGESSDCNGNGVPDECEIADGVSMDCDGNGTPDECDIAMGAATDCDSNGLIDQCELADGAGADCNGNGIHDVCELNDGADGSGDPSHDCNQNGALDECELADGAADDCNANGVPDPCDLDDGTSQDCNANGVPDDCDISDGTSADSDANGVPDECAAEDDEDQTPDPQEPGDGEGEGNGVDRTTLRNMLALLFNVPADGNGTLASIPVEVLGILGVSMALRLMLVELFDLPVRWLLFELTYALLNMMLP